MDYYIYNRELRLYETYAREKELNKLGIYYIETRYIETRYIKVLLTKLYSNIYEEI